MVASWPPEKRAAWWASLTEADQIALAYDWRFYARPAQLQPTWLWVVLLWMAGRGFGKTRCGAEAINGWANVSGPGARFFLAGRTAADVRDTMIQGESGLIEIARPDNRPRYFPSQRAVRWPSGASALCFTAEEPDQPRGPQTHCGWADEVGAWDQYGWEFWMNLMLGMRLKRNDGMPPQCVASTTPRPTRLVRYLVNNASQDGGRDGKWLHLEGGSTYDNMDNLPEVYRQQILGAYEGTRLGDQEIWGKLLTDVEGSIFKPAWLDKDGFRVGIDSVPELPACVVGVDPAASSKKESSANTGIITGGLGVDQHYYILRDDTLRGTPREWGRAAVEAYKAEEADHITAEANNGGEMVQHVISTVDGNVPVKLVYAARGKATRAEPVSSLYEQGKVHHAGRFDALEDEMTNWVPGKPSPDRMDAMVWCVTDLMGGKVLAQVDPGAVIDASPLKQGDY